MKMTASEFTRNVGICLALDAELHARTRDITAARLWKYHLIFYFQTTPPCSCPLNEQDHFTIQSSPSNRPSRVGLRVQLYACFDPGSRWAWMINATSRPFYPLERDPVYIVREARWAPGPVWACGEISPTKEFDPQTAQPVASRYTDCATRAHPYTLLQRFPNCGPRTTGGPRVLPLWSS
jgi:hypothetical protein